MKHQADKQLLTRPQQISEASKFYIQDKLDAMIDVKLGIGE